MLRPTQALAPSTFAGFPQTPARIRSEVAVAGFPFEGALGAASLNFGTLADLRGLNGDERIARLDLAVEPSEIGAPVLDATGAVIGIVLPEPETGRALPEGVSFALRGDRLAEALSGAGVTLNTAPAAGEALTRNGLARYGSRPCGAGDLLELRHARQILLKAVPGGPPFACRDAGLSGVTFPGCRLGGLSRLSLFLNERLVLLDKAYFSRCDTAYQSASVHSTIDRSWRAGSLVNAALHPASDFHCFQRLRQGTIRNRSEVSFDIIEVARPIDRRKHRQSPRAAKQILIFVSSDALNSIGDGSGRNAKLC